jgi:hypothetical protein
VAQAPNAGIAEPIIRGIKEDGKNSPKRIKEAKRKEKQQDNACHGEDQGKDPQVQIRRAKYKKHSFNEPDKKRLPRLGVNRGTHAIGDVSVMNGIGIKRFGRILLQEQHFLPEGQKKNNCEE